MGRRRRRELHSKRSRRGRWRIGNQWNLSAWQEKLIRIEEFVGEEVTLGDEPDLALGVCEDEITLAGFGGVVGTEDLIDEIGVEVGVLDRVGAGDAGAFHWMNFDEETRVDVHKRELNKPWTGRGYFERIKGMLRKQAIVENCLEEEMRCIDGVQSLRG